MNSLKTSMGFTCRGLNTITDYISHPSISVKNFECSSEAAIFFSSVCPRIQMKMYIYCFAYLAVNMMKHYPFLMFKSMKTQFFMTKTIFCICLLLLENSPKIMYISLMLMM